MGRVTLAILASLQLAIGFAASASAQVYRWEDAQGNERVTNTPPPRGARVLDAMTGTRSPATSPAAPEPVERSFDLRGELVTLAVPPECHELEADEEEELVATFACAHGEERVSALLSLTHAKAAPLSPREFEEQCRKTATSALTRGAQRFAGEVQVSEASCDTARHWLVLKGSMSSAGERFEVELVMVPVTDGFVAAIAGWKRGAPSSTAEAVRAATRSLSVADDYRVWPMSGATPASAEPTVRAPHPVEKQPPAAHSPSLAPGAMWVLAIGAIAALAAIFRATRR